MKTITKLMVGLLCFGQLIGCGSNSNNAQPSGSVDVSNVKTLGDAMALEGDSSSSTWDENYFYYETSPSGVPMLFIAKSSKEVSDQIDEAFGEPDVDVYERIMEIAAPLEIVKIVDLSKDIPSQEELDKLIGKTGADLLADGFWPGGGYQYLDNSTMFYLNKGAYQYEVEFNEKLERDDDMNEEEAIKPLTVKKVTYSGLSGDFSEYKMD
ncbi:MAG: hypothetical protein J6D29_03200 [Solobacterium sp.]|nr:hypothetical protein [Solobacterium sp.]